MVESVDETVEFYTNILGFTKTFSVPKENGKMQFALVAKDSLTLMFQDRENLIEEYPNLTTEKTQPCLTFYITVDNFLELYEELKEKYELLADMRKTFYGANEFAIKDNNGYVLTFTETTDKQEDDILEDVF